MQGGPCPAQGAWGQWGSELRRDMIQDTGDVASGSVTVGGDTEVPTGVWGRDLGPPGWGWGTQR